MPRLASRSYMAATLPRLALASPPAYLAYLASPPAARTQVHAAEGPDDETELVRDPCEQQTRNDERRLQGGNVKSKKTQKLHSLLAGAAVTSVTSVTWVRSVKAASAGNAVHVGNVSKVRNIGNPDAEGAVRCCSHALIGGLQEGRRMGPRICVPPTLFCAARAHR